VGINALVGALIGQERSLIPLLAEREFGIASGLATSAFLVTFGLTKAPSNLVAGLLAERFGPKRVLIMGWVVGVPVPLLLMWAPTWGWVIAANLLLGINQGLTWSTTVLMKIQLADDHERGRAVGLNEFAGYTAVGLSALGSGLLADRFGIRPEPFLLGLLVVAGGAALSLLVVRDTQVVASLRSHLQLRALFRDRLLRTCARTGLVNNANDAFAWALLPLLLAEAELSTTQIAGVAATYPIVWGPAAVHRSAIRSDRQTHPHRCRNAPAGRSSHFFLAHPAARSSGHGGGFGSRHSARLPGIDSRGS